MEEPLITLHLQLTEAEITSLLMAQIVQTQRSRLTCGESAHITSVDRSVLEKLINAQQRDVVAGAAGKVSRDRS